MTAISRLNYRKLPYRQKQDLINIFQEKTRHHDTNNTTSPDHTIDLVCLLLPLLVIGLLPLLVTSLLQLLRDTLATGSRLNTLLHSIQMRKLVSILAQTPSHNTTKLLRLDDVLELASNECRSVPGPENIDLGVPVVLATRLLISCTVGLGPAPGVDDRDSFAGSVVGKTACLAEIVARATREVSEGSEYKGRVRRRELTSFHTESSILHLGIWCPRHNHTCHR